MFCSKCSNTGRILLKGYAHGFYNCDCQPLPQEHYQDLTPDCFDYPMSATFRAASFAYCGVIDPGRTDLPDPALPAEQVIVHRHSNMSQAESELLQHISKTLEQHINYKRKKIAESY